MKGRKNTIGPEPLLRLNSYLDALEWTDSRLVRELGFTRTAINQWRRLDNPIPPYVFAFLEAVLASVEAAKPYQPCKHFKRYGRGNKTLRAKADALELERLRAKGFRV